MFVLYYMATPGFQVVLFGTHKSDTSPLGRFAYVLLVVFCFTAILYMNVMCTWVSRAAHKSYPILYRLILHMDRRYPLRHRLRVQSFIERLSGPEITFYCYDMFPMNSYEFYQFVCIAGSNYFLIMSLF